MAKNYTCDADMFSDVMTELLQGINADVKNAAQKPVKRALSKAKKDTKAAASMWSKPVHLTKGAYPEGFQYRTQRDGDEIWGEMGNKTYPGLVHLLEKGHATIGQSHAGGAGRTRAYPHMKADGAFKQFERELSQAVGDAL